MSLLIGFLLSLWILAFAPVLAMAESSTTFRDASGRQTGTASTNSSGVTTFRDASGRQTGTASSSGNGVTFRDSMGRQTGTATRGR